MKHGRILYGAACFMLGAAMFGGGAAYAAGAIAERSTNTVYVDGQQVELEAYLIGGANYVKLRDVGQTVGFNVYWNGAVQIESGAPYTGEAPASAAAGNTSHGETHFEQDAPASPAPTGATVTLPTDGASKYVPKVGDLIPCDDGTVYEVKDVSRWESNVYMDGPMPDMPTPTCDWSLFPTRDLPKVEVRHFSDQYGDNIFVRNLYEVRRMQYTIYNALGKEPSAWRDGKPLATVQLTTPAEYEAYTAKFWPWSEAELNNLVHSRPNSRYYIDAWDYYHNGIFQYTRYCVLSL